MTRKQEDKLLPEVKNVYNIKEILYQMLDNSNVGTFITPAEFSRKIEDFFNKKTGYAIDVPAKEIESHIRKYRRHNTKFKHLENGLYVKVNLKERRMRSVV